MATTDFVMPKLGLTMTEGTVARWDVAPGSRFAAGDVILVVETDKIAYDVEAPAAGILREVLVAAGNAVPVGTPIGRWDVGDIKASLDAPGMEARAASPAASDVVEAPVAALAAPPKGEGGARMLATPFARRLAGQSGIDLRKLNGTGPRGRIKAADVERAVAAGRPTSAAATSAAVGAARTAAHSAGTEIDVTSLLALNEQINADLPDLHADLAHYVVLAAAKATDAFSEPLVIGLATAQEGEARPVSVFAGADCRTLGGVVALAAHSAAGSDPLRGTLWIESTLPGISFWAADPPDGWSAALHVGAVRDTFRPDATGRPVRAALINVVLTARAAELDRRSAQQLLRRIRDLLETPLLLLAS